MKILGYILIFYIGFYFYRLAENHHKNKWIFGFLGIAIYFLGLVIYPLYIRFFDNLELFDFNLVVISFKSFTIGLVLVFISFQFLSFIWKPKKKTNKEDIEKIGK